MNMIIHMVNTRVSLAQCQNWLLLSPRTVSLRPEITNGIPKQVRKRRGNLRFFFKTLNKKSQATF